MSKNTTSAITKDIKMNTTKINKLKKKKKNPKSIESDVEVIHFDIHVKHVTCQNINNNINMNTTEINLKKNI